MRRTGATMNQGMFETLISRLDRLIELLEAQRPTIVAVPNDASAIEIMEQLNQVAPMPAAPKAPAKRSKAA